MKLDGKTKRIIIFILIIILVPIAYHQISGVIMGIMQAKAMSRPVEVQTMTPEVKEIYTESESAGRLDAKDSVDVLARINGWLEKRYFAEGAKIKKGQTLFLIDPNEYQIAVNNASANVRQTLAVLTNAKKELIRAEELVKKDYVSKSYYDEALANRDRSQASYDAAKAQLANAQLNLSYTKITSPIDGKIGKIIITEGNLVNPQSGPLARIVSISPIFAYFTLKSADYINLKKNDESKDLSDMEVKLILANGTLYNENGKIEFINNEIDETTGTISLRATFENKDELLVPGDFVTVKLKSAKPKKVLLVPQASALSDSNGYYVWTVDKDNKAVRKDIKVGEEIDKKWVVEEGLEEGEVFVGKGIQSIRFAGQVVNPKEWEEVKAQTEQKPQEQLTEELTEDQLNEEAKEENE
ncbi:efflux RND transporter periplasmic adaptor subunit [bacterium]|nr:efflux RND transporter periplasmic adaptor subunit [bacterium]